MNIEEVLASLFEQQDCCLKNDTEQFIRIEIMKSRIFVRTVDAMYLSLFGVMLKVPSDSIGPADWIEDFDCYCPAGC